MSKSISADTLIQEGVDEFKMAAAKTATGIIEQGLAVLKIKQGCAKKQGGSDFPDVVMELLGLSGGTARSLAAIGENAEKLVTVVTSLPPESLSTIYQISRMDEDTIADKIKRGVITPTATRDQVLEQVRVQTSTTKKSKGATSKGNDIQTVFANLSAKDQRIILDEVKKAKAEVRKAAKAEAKEQMQKAREQQQRNVETREKLDAQLTLVRSPFSREEFKLISGMLHPDRHPGNEERAQRAFDIFRRVEEVCKPALKAVK